MKLRLGLLAAFFGLWFLASAARLGYLQIERHEHYFELAEQQQQRVVELSPPRGTIFSRDGRELAVSGPADSVYAVPREIKDVRSTALALSLALAIPAQELTPKLSGSGWFVWLKRQISPEEAERVKALKLAGIALKEESKRFYPQGQLAAHVVGFVGTDSHGLAGLEQTFDAKVTGKVTKRVVLRDAGGRVAVDPDQGLAEAEAGQDLYLTLDSTLQHLVERELASIAESSGAPTASAVFLDPFSGAVLAMASYPSFDPNRFNDGAFGDLRERKERWKNRVITDAYEPGSTFKMVPVAAAIEAGLVDGSDVFDCQMGQIVVYGKLIRDHKPFAVLTLRDVMAKSSNVGAIKVGMKAGGERLYRQIVGLGFGRKTGIELPGESPGILRPFEKWQPITKAYVSFGQGVAVTSLQLATAFAAVANGGQLVKPYLVERIGVERIGVEAIGRGEQVEVLHRGPEVVGQAMSPSTARQLERLLESVTLEGGTGKKAAVEGYWVAGKTGTAQMADKGGYSLTDHMAVFAGFAPGRAPRLVGAVVVGKPRGDFHGGSVAAPVFGGVVSQALVYLGVRPERNRPEPWPGELGAEERAVQLAALTAAPAAVLGEPEEEPPYIEAEESLANDRELTP